MAEQSTNNNNSNKSAKIILIVGIIVIIVLLGVILFLLLGRKEQSQSQQEEKRAVVVTEEKAEEIAEELINQEYVAPGYYETVMSTTWHFASGDAVSEDAYVENVVENTNDVYFDLFLEDDENNPIYESPIIPRGKHLDNIKLDKKLDAGTYECIVVYHLVDEEQNTLSELRVGLTVIVEN